MGRSPCCDESGLKKGPWTPEEDEKLIKYIQKHGHSSWRALPKLAGLNRCGKSCRLRWTNYLRPDIKRGKFSHEEEQTILNLHAVLGNKWSTIASHLPGRTDNEIKNFWNTHLKKKLIQMGFDPMTHRPRTDILSSLSQLISLQPNLKGLFDLQNQQYPMDDQAILRFQTEMAKLELLQYLLQPSLMNNFNPSDHLDPLKLLNSISSLKQNTNITNPDSSLFSSSYLQEFKNLPALRTLDSNLESPADDDDLLLQNDEFEIFGQKENLPISLAWNITDPTDSSTRAQLFSHVHSSAVAENINPSTNPYVFEDVCSSITASTSSCHEPAASASASASVAWPDLLLDVPLFPAIH